MAWIDDVSDKELAYEVTGPGQSITRSANQIRAFREQEKAKADANMSLSDFLAKFSGGGTPSQVSQTNRFEPGLSDAELRLRSLLDNPDSIKQSGAYKFRVKQGEDALQRQLGARGLLNSGNRLMELTKYGQDMATQEYDAQAGRLSDLLGRYSASWIGDKNANISAADVENRNRLGYANLWGQMIRSNQNQPSQVISRATSGLDLSKYNPGGFVNSNVSHINGIPGFGSLATADDPLNTGFGIRDAFGRASGRSTIN